MDQYLQSIFQRLYEEDGLCVLARGLGLVNILTKFIMGYHSRDKKRVVLCLNLLGSEEALVDTMRSEGVVDEGEFPVVISGEVLSSDRSK